MTRAYPLKNIAAKVKDDGTAAFITLSLEGREDCVFSISLEGAGVLSTHISHLCREMSQRLVSSGASEERMKSAKETLPLHVLSARRALLGDEQKLLLSFQTEEGPLIELLIPDEIAGPLLTSEDGPLPPSRGLQ